MRKSEQYEAYLPVRSVAVLHALVLDQLKCHTASLITVLYPSFHASDGAVLERHGHVRRLGPHL